MVDNEVYPLEQDFLDIKFARSKYDEIVVSIKYAITYTSESKLLNLELYTPLWHDHKTITKEMAESRDDYLSPDTASSEGMKSDLVMAVVSTCC